MEKITKIIALFLIISMITTTSCESDAATPETDEQGENSSDNADEDGDDENGEETSENATSAVEKHGLLQVSGNKILDKNQEAVQLRGMSLFWSQWMGQYYTKEAVSWLKKDWECNVIRAAMGVEDADGYLSNREVEKQKVFTVIDAAIQEGIYVIIDWHSHHAEDHLEEAKAFFAEVAQKYGDQPNIIYEPYNEPLQAPSWNSVLKPYHEQVIAEIRKYDPDNLIICGTRTWSQDVDEVIGNEINDKNVAYTLHYYAATHKQFLRDKAQRALDADIPLFVTEYGTTEASGNGFLDKDEALVWWNFLDQNKISWCNWSIADKQETASALEPGASGTGDWSENQITESGKMVRNEIKTKNPEY
ncbi:glycoside hydrolase family 5 protein [Aquimarina algicola]|uniref:Glycoside hydrolase family 5 protein n=1 Tax=Aquimarina algicola TaxID=2589995 RepID=A0A504JC95_9FLAO|nr:glycoside hydrolase family 5 protein [Aquimarina algicola]TPN84549.1 glycoside hydrolase family 5 protein [Aquimarina algicola]